MKQPKSLLSFDQVMITTELYLQYGCSTVVGKLGNRGNNRRQAEGQAIRKDHA